MNVHGIASFIDGAILFGSRTAGAVAVLTNQSSNITGRTRLKRQGNLS